MVIKFNIPKIEQDETDPLLPIMSLILIIIPILVGNIAFYHFHAVRVNAPAVGSAADSASQEKPKAEVKVMAKLRINENDFNLELLEEESGNILIQKQIKRDSTGIVQLRKEFESLIKEYAKLDLVLLSSFKELKYDQLMNILDSGVKSILDKEKRSVLKVVMIPEEV